jgi:hypothetical protein
MPCAIMTVGPRKSKPNQPYRVRKRNDLHIKDSPAAEHFAPAEEPPAVENFWAARAKESWH